MRRRGRSIVLALAALAPETSMADPGNGYLVRDLWPVPFGSSNPTSGALYKDRLYFFARDSAQAGADIWVTDGSHVGTTKAVDLEGQCFKVYRSASECFPQNLVASGAYLYFLNSDAEHGVQLWRSSGTLSGTRIVRVIDDAFIETGENHEVFGQLTDAGGKLFFVAGDGASFEGGRGIWRSDGSESGTVQLRRFTVGTPRNLTNVAGTLYFSVANELWKSDGSTQGTARVKVFQSRFIERILHTFGAVGKTLFFSGDDGSGMQLWLTEGAAPRRVGFFPGSQGSPPHEIVDVGGEAYFLLERTDSTLEDLWKSDGTDAGTGPVAPIFPSGRLYSTGDQLLAVSGRSLWQSDGTPAGTRRVFDNQVDADLGGRPGVEELLGIHDGLVLLSAGDPVHEIELWALAAPDLYRKEFIIDNGASGTKATGTWQVSGAKLPYGSNSVWSKGTTTQSPAYAFTAALPPAAYEVFEWHTLLSTRASSVIHQVRYDSGVSNVIVNQQVNGGQWNSIGEFDFFRTGQVTILARDRVRSTNADAIRFVGRKRELPVARIDEISPLPGRQGADTCFRGHGQTRDDITAIEWTSSLESEVLLSVEASFCSSKLVPGDHEITLRVRDSSGAWSLPARKSIHVDSSCEIIVDEKSVMAGSSGAWSPSPAPEAYQGASLWAKPAVGTGSIQFTFAADLPSGRYEVFEWHSVWATRSKTAEHRISPEVGASSVVVVDQSARGGQWNSLGTFSLGGRSTVTILAKDTKASTNADAVRFVCRP